MKRILIVAAHPDDETLGCGATAAAHAAAGDQVFALILGEGMTSRFTAPGKADALLHSLHSDAKKASAVLGFKRIRFANFPDNSFDTLPLLKIVKRIEQEIEELKPAIVYTHHSGDLNIDHRQTFEAVLAATRPMAGCSVEEVNTFYIPSSSEWSFGHVRSIFRPNLFIDATKTIRKKVAAMKVYKHEIRRSPHPRSQQMLNAVSHYWGSIVGLPYAEAFETIRTIRKLKTR